MSYDILILYKEKGVCVVKEKTSEKEQKRLGRKVKILDDIFDGCLMFGGVLGGFAAIALLMGGTAEIVSDLSMNQKAQAIYETAEYQSIASEGMARLDEKLANGEISKAQYDDGVDALYSIPEVIKAGINAVGPGRPMTL